MYMFYSGVSLIAGMDYGMDGECTQNMQLNHVTDALLSLGWAIPTTDCMGSYLTAEALWASHCWHTFITASSNMHA